MTGHFIVDWNYQNWYVRTLGKATTMILPLGKSYFRKRTEHCENRDHVRHLHQIAACGAKSPRVTDYFVLLAQSYEMGKQELNRISSSTASVVEAIPKDPKKLIKQLSELVYMALVLDSGTPTQIDMIYVRAHRLGFQRADVDWMIKSLPDAVSREVSNRTSKRNDGGAFR